MNDRLYFKQIEMGPMQNFVYLIGSLETRKVAVVDAAWEVDEILRLAAQDDMEVTHAFVTHTHPDHVGGRFAGIEIEGVTKLYRMGSETVHALRGVDVRIHRNEYLAIMGPSGSGKSTLMNMLGCLDTPTAGRYEFSGKNVATMVDDELAGDGGAASVASDGYVLC